MILKYLPKKKILLFAGDVLLISLAFLLAEMIRFRVFTWDLTAYAGTGAIIVAAHLLGFYLADLYNFELSFSTARYAFRFLAAITIVTLALATVFFFLPSMTAGRIIFLLNYIFVGLLAFSWRLLFEWWLKNILKRPNKLLIIGAGKAGMELYDFVKDRDNFQITGFVDDDRSKAEIKGLPYMGATGMLKELVGSTKVNMVILAAMRIENPSLISSIIDCKMKGVRVLDLPSFYEVFAGNIPVEHTNKLWFVSNPIAGVEQSVYNVRIKKVIDLTLATIGLGLSLPLCALISIAIKMESEGPVFYRQNRVGLRDETFEIIKFRSMNVGAEKNGAVWAIKNDSRVTRVGKVIRKLRLDEIPQMWNVLKGEMSFIGPRPERPEFVSGLTEKIPFYSLRHSVRPGITGWAQVSYPYGASDRDAVEKLKYDLFYIKNVSPLMDFHILIKTVRVVLLGKGAR